MYLHFPTLKAILTGVVSRDSINARYVLRVAAFLSAFFFVRAVVSLFRGLDWILYSRFRHQAVRAPLFIVGNPRSGTTLVHRLISADSQFTTTKLYQTIIPSVTLYRVVERIERADQRYLHGRVRRWVGRLVERSFSAWKGIHLTRLGLPEEDEQYFVFTLLTPVITLLFPFFDRLPDATFVDRSPIRVQKRLMRHYRRCLQRHLYATGQTKSLLIKNTSMTGRIEATLREFPDARIVHIIRHPYEALPSLLSMYSHAWNVLTPHLTDRGRTARSLAALYCDYYDHFRTLNRSASSPQVLELRYEDLLSDSSAFIRKIYEHFGMAMSEEMENKLVTTKRCMRTYQSRHDYSLRDYGISPQVIRERLDSSFREYSW